MFARNVFNSELDLSLFLTKSFLDFSICLFKASSLRFNDSSSFLMMQISQKRSKEDAYALDWHRNCFFKIIYYLYLYASEINIVWKQ